LTAKAQFRRDLAWMETAVPEVYAKRATAFIFELQRFETRKKNKILREQVMVKSIEKDLKKGK